MLLAVIQNDTVLLAALEAAVAPYSGSGVRLQHVESVNLALARIGGGGVEGILFDLSRSDVSLDDAVAGWQHIAGEADRVPIVILSSAADEVSANRLCSREAFAVVVKDRHDDLRRAISAILQRSEQGRVRLRRSLSQRQIAFIGAKGGVGTTLTALNLAAIRARAHAVILAEMHPEIGSLAVYFGIQNKVRRPRIGAGETMSAGHNWTASALRSALWRCPREPGLQILFAGGENPIVTAGDAAAICSALTELAGTVIVDLPNTRTALNRAIIEASALVAVVVNREPVCLGLAGRLIAEIRSWNSAPEVGIVLVNLAALSITVPIPKIEADLGAQVLGAIPPAPDLCVYGQQQHTPAVLLEPEGPLAGSLSELSSRAFPTGSAHLQQSAIPADRRTQSWY